MELVGQVEVEGTVGLQGETQAPTIYPGGMEVEGGTLLQSPGTLGPWRASASTSIWRMVSSASSATMGSRGPGSEETEGTGDMQSEGPNCLFLSQECLLLSPEGDLCGHGVGEG